MDGTGVPVPEHLWFVGQVPDLPLLQNLSMAGREPAPQPSPNVETPDTGRNCFLRGDDRLWRSRCCNTLHCLPRKPREKLTLQDSATVILVNQLISGVRRGHLCKQHRGCWPFCRSFVP